MRLFNLFQIVTTFAAGLSLIAWISSGPFRGAEIAWGTGVTAHAIGFGLMIVGVWSSTNPENWR